MRAITALVIECVRATSAKLLESTRFVPVMVIDLVLLPDILTLELEMEVIVGEKDGSI